MELRQKLPIPSSETDLDLFQSLKMDDAWVDAQMPSVFIELYKDDKLRIPESWEPTMTFFYTEMKRYAAWLSYTCAMVDMICVCMHVMYIYTYINIYVY